jgi:LPS sulfotransferase NodH
MMARPRYFVILGAMRTGSNLLEQTLGALGDTACWGEVFNPAFIGGPQKSDLLGWDKDRRDGDPLGCLEALIEGSGDRIAGFRLFDGHSDVVLSHVLSDPDCARIVLRRDPLQSFVSLQIARTTNQWMLRNPRRRLTAKITFEAEEFAIYRADLFAHYGRLKTDMEAASLSAFDIDYDQMSDPAVLQAVAQHVGSQGQVPTGPVLHRQNPESLRDKVANYGEMCTALGMEEEPRRAPDLVTARDVLVMPEGPMALAPIEGPGLAAMLSLMQWVDSGLRNTQVLPRKKLPDMAARGELFTSGFDAQTLPDKLGLSRVFAPVCHPATRMHALFLEELFGPGWAHAPVRAMIEAEIGPLPEPREVRRDATVFPQTLRRGAFRTYLGIVKAALAGQGQFSPRLAWYPQADLVDAYAQEVRLDRVVELEKFDVFARRYCKRVSLPPLPDFEAEDMSRAGLVLDFAVDETLDADTSAILEEIYAEDYRRFGYASLPPTSDGVSSSL